MVFHASYCPWPSFPFYDKTVVIFVHPFEISSIWKSTKHSISKGDPWTTFFFLIDYEWFALDRSYLVTSTNSEWTRLREQQEQREEDEAEMESLWEKIERRQPLADLSEKTTGTRQCCSFRCCTAMQSLSSETANARPVTTNQPAPRVPPLKIKLPGPEKTVRPPVIVPPLNSKYYCDLKLERVDLSLYNISNLPTAPVPETKVANKNSAPSNGAKIKPKPPVVTKPYEHRKPLKRLNSSDPKKSSPSASSSSSSTSPTDLPRPKPSSSSIRSISTDTTSSSIAGKSKTPSITTTAEHRRVSLNSSAPQTKSSHSTVKSGEQATTQKKLKRPQLPAEYRCSLPISRLNLSLYNLPIPPATTPMVTERRTTGTYSSGEQRQMTWIDSLIELLSSSRSSVQQMECATASLETNISPGREQTVNRIHWRMTSFCRSIDTTEPTLAMELENREESNSATIVSSKALEDSHPDEVQPSSIDQVLTPETFDSSSSMSNDDTAALSLNILPPALLKELSSIPECDVPSPSVNESDINKSVPTMNDEMQPISENTNIISAFSDTSACINSLELPALEDDASLFPMASLENTSIDPLTLISQDCMIIVECSDHEDEFDADDNDVLNEIENLMTSADSEKIALASPSETTSFSRSLNPLLNRGKYPRLVHVDTSLSRLISSACHCCQHRITSSIHLIIVFIAIGRLTGILSVRSLSSRQIHLGEYALQSKSPNFTLSPGNPRFQTHSQETTASQISHSHRSQSNDDHHTIPRPRISHWSSFDISLTDNHHRSTLAYSLWSMFDLAALTFTLHFLHTNHHSRSEIFHRFPWPTPWITENSDLEQCLSSTDELRSQSIHHEPRSCREASLRRDDIQHQLFATPRVSFTQDYNYWW